MTASKQDVETSRKRVDDLRAQIAAEKHKAAAAAVGGESTLLKAQLDREAERLEQELSLLKNANKNDPDALVKQVDAAQSAPVSRPANVSPDKEGEK